MSCLISACNSSEETAEAVSNFPRYYDVQLSTIAQTCAYQGESLMAENLSGELVKKGTYYYLILSSETDEINLIGEMCLDENDEPSYFCLRAKTRIRYQQFDQGCEMQLRIPSTEIPNLENWSNQEKVLIRDQLSCCHLDPADDNGIKLSPTKNDAGVIDGLRSEFKAGIFINQYLDNSKVSEQCLSNYACELQINLEATVK
jgi:hypothetical protein